MKEILDKAKKFIYRNARPLDLARFQYHFENADKENVLKALAFYQNDDGGFAFALEPDCWNEHSTPLQTWAATRILEEISYNEKSSDMIQGIISFLTSGKEFKNGFWYGLNDVKSNEYFPHAPWWGYSEDANSSYNPTASLAGFLLKYTEKESEAYNMARSIAMEAYTYLKQNVPIESMHETACFVELYEYLDSADILDIVNMVEFKKILEEQMDHLITKDISLWNTEYICKPSLFIKSPSSPFYEANKDICMYEMQFIKEKQNEDGTWNVTWDWNDYLEQWSIAKNWWKSDIIINNLRFINNFANHMNLGRK